MRIPRLIVAAASSGSGKTSFALGLMAALRRRGLDVRPFKAGPDYIDAGLHAAAVGRPSRSLDLFQMERKGVLGTLSRNASPEGVAVIEGVMGYLDGLERGASTSCLALSTASPVVLLVDAAAAAESAGAVALGFSTAREPSLVRAVVLNRVAGLPHYETARRAVEDLAGLPVLGYLPNDARLALPERHLGLVQASESAGFPAVLDSLARAVEDGIDLDALLALARSAPDLPGTAGAFPDRPCAAEIASGKPVRVAVARDEAFSFIYEDNLDLMRDSGLVPAFFSPLRDRALPADIAGLYLCGGYPELHCSTLAANAAMRDSIRLAVGRGLPTFAECGGMLYLAESLAGPDGVAWPMCGALEARGSLGPSLAELGYRETVTARDSPLGPAGTALKGHVFHYSTIDPPLPRTPPNVFASWLHLHFAGNPEALSSFAASCRRFARGPGRDAAAEG